MITEDRFSVFDSKSTKKIQERIIRYRKEIKKISQDEMARLLGVPRTTYAYNESRATDLSIDFIEQVASALNIPTKHLLFDMIGEPPPPRPKVESFITTHNEQKLIEKYRLLPTELKKEVRDIVDNMYADYKIKK